MALRQATQAMSDHEPANSVERNLKGQGVARLRRGRMAPEAVFAAKKKKVKEVRARRTRGPGAGGACFIGSPGGWRAGERTKSQAVARVGTGPRPGEPPGPRTRIGWLGGSDDRPPAAGEGQQDTAGRTGRKARAGWGPNFPFPSWALRCPLPSNAALGGYRPPRPFSLRVPSHPTAEPPGGSVTHRSPSVERMPPGWLVVVRGLVA